jgi:hypothetical protein
MLLLQAAVLLMLCMCSSMTWAACLLLGRDPMIGRWQNATGAQGQAGGLISRPPELLVGPRARAFVSKSRNDLWEGPHQVVHVAGVGTSAGQSTSALAAIHHNQPSIRECRPSMNGALDATKPVEQTNQTRLTVTERETIEDCSEQALKRSPSHLLFAIGVKETVLQRTVAPPIEERAPGRPCYRSSLVDQRFSLLTPDPGHLASAVT